MGEWEACLTLCRDSKHCNLWIWVENTQTSYAHDCNLISAGEAVKDPNVVSGPRECEDYTCKEDGVNYTIMPGNVTIQEVGSWQACLAHCDGASPPAPRCSHWVWVPGAGGAGGHACHLMYHPGEPR